MSTQHTITSRIQFLLIFATETTRTIFKFVWCVRSHVKRQIRSKNAFGKRLKPRKLNLNSLTTGARTEPGGRDERYSYSHKTVFIGTLTLTANNTKLLTGGLFVVNIPEG